MKKTAKPAPAKTTTGYTQKLSGNRSVSLTKRENGGLHFHFVNWSGAIRTDSHLLVNPDAADAMAKLLLIYGHKAQGVMAVEMNVETLTSKAAAGKARKWK